MLELYAKTAEVVADDGKVVVDDDAHVQGRTGVRICVGDSMAAKVILFLDYRDGMALVCKSYSRVGARRPTADDADIAL